MSATLPIFEINQGEFTEKIRGRLCAAFSRYRSPAKTLARHADVNPRTAKAWLEGKSTPHALQFLRLLATVPELEAEVRRLTGLMSENDPDVQRLINDLVSFELRRRQVAAERDEG